MPSFISAEIHRESCSVPRMSGLFSRGNEKRILTRGNSLGNLVAGSGDCRDFEIRRKPDLRKVFLEQPRDRLIEIAFGHAYLFQEIDGVRKTSLFGSLRSTEPREQ